jgi:hypothetical protein
MADEHCAHLFTHATHSLVDVRTHGMMWLDRVRCDDCPEQVVLRVYDDPRDDRLREHLHPDGEHVRLSEKYKDR